MNRPANTRTIEETLANNGVWVSTTAGTSMWPMLRDRRDTVVVRPTTEPLQKYDVALYLRGSSYVLHRVIGFTRDGYRILGDNCLATEDVPAGTVLGRLDEFWRGERRCDPRNCVWLAYARVWLAIWPARRLLMRARAAGRARKAVAQR